MSWMMDALATIVAPVTEIVKGYQARKTLEVEQSDKQADRDHEIRLKKADVAFELAKQSIQVESEWDTNAQNQMQYSWKDEWFVMLFSIPLILSFVPPTSGYILDGFNILAQTPEWYMWLVSGIVSATFGIRFAFNKIAFKK